MEAEATALGKTTDDLVTERLRESLRDKSWHGLLVHGRKYGEASGIGPFASVILVPWE